MDRRCGIMEDQVSIMPRLLESNWSAGVSPASLSRRRPHLISIVYRISSIVLNSHSIRIARLNNFS